MERKDRTQDVNLQPSEIGRLEAASPVEDGQTTTVKHMDDADFDRHLQAVLSAHGRLLVKLAE